MPNKKELERIKLPESKTATGWYSMEAGKEHYRLLAYLCSGLDLVFDVGSYQGMSALAMSTAKRVISYDVQIHEKLIKPKRHNIEFKIGDVRNDKELLSSQLILIDTFHNGKFEREFFDFLIKKKYKGFVLFDDIRLNHMVKFWEYAKTKGKAVDLTDIGHYTGTGLICLKSNNRNGKVWYFLFNASSNGSRGKYGLFT